MTSGHDPEWPDKIMAAAMFVIMGGLLATLYGAMHFADVTFNADSAWFGVYIPPWWAMGTGMLAVVVGVFAYIHQAWLLVTMGVVLDVVSVGMVGAASIIGLFAVWPLVRAFMEGEETRWTATAWTRANGRTRRSWVVWSRCAPAS